jgi:RNA polymerase sigma-70 factor (ECF subfamily)
MLSQQSRTPGTYKVLINSDQQLVAWPDTKAAPEGWQRTGVAGTQADCVAFIDADWRTREKPDPPTDDSGLVEWLRAGDEAAFGALVDRYHASFVRLAVGYVRDRSIAEEVAQEAWLGILRGLHQFAGRASFKTWMFRILVNCAKHRAVWESRFVAFSEHWGEAEDPSDRAVPSEWFRSSGDQWPGGWLVFPGDWGDEPEQRLVSEETRRELAAMIERLPFRHRQVLVLRDVEGLSANEVCETLEQLTLARLLESGVYERNLRRLRRHRRQRRDTLLEALHRSHPGARVSGTAAGLHLVLKLPDAMPASKVAEAAAREGLALAGVQRYALVDGTARDDRLVLGYGNLSTGAIDAAVRRLAEAVRTVT